MFHNKLGLFSEGILRLKTAVDIPGKSLNSNFQNISGDSIAT